MPPSLPTGTVSSTSAGTRTFPPESDRERASAASAGPSRHPQVQPLPTTPRPDLEPAPRRDHDQVTELKQENEALREYIETQAAERQAVIERYERLLEHREADVEAETTATPRSTPASTSTSTADDDSRLGVRTALSSLRSRIARRLGLD